MAKSAIFLQNILQESCSKFYFKQCSHKKFLKILILQHEYIEMCFHGNQHPWAIMLPFISLYSKYQSLKFICLPVMISPVFPSLDDIYCILSIWLLFLFAHNYHKRNLKRHDQVTFYQPPLSLSPIEIGIIAFFAGVERFFCGCFLLANVW